MWGKCREQTMIQGKEDWTYKDDVLLSSGMSAILSSEASRGITGEENHFLFKEVFNIPSLREYHHTTKFFF